MNNRFPASNRDRSPPRYDRRPSANPHPSGGSSYRGAADSAQPPPDRGPPLGPKAEPFGSSSRFPYSPATRGRGAGPNTFASRPPTYDRDRDRDARPSQPYRSRDEDRPEWPRRDRDLIPGDRATPTIRESRPFIGRDRSASPARARRDSRESLPPLSARPSDAAHYYGPGARGGLARGRGRGDLDRVRGRNSFVGDRDRDLFSNPSHSRDGWRGERDFDRGRPAPTDRDVRDRFDRRDPEKSRERDVRVEHDTWSRDRDHSPGRASTGASVGRGVSPIAPASAATSHYGSADRASKMDYEVARRSSAVLTPGRERRDHDQADYFASRSEPLRREGQPVPYPAQPVSTSASAAGLDYGPPPSITTPAAEKPGTSTPAPLKLDAASSTTPSFLPPSGPKAERLPSTSVAPHPSKTASQQEPATKTEPSIRPARPPPAPAGPTGGAGQSEFVHKQGDVKFDSKPPMPQTPDKTLPANVPVGPRSSLGVGFKPRQPSSEPLPNPPQSIKPVLTDHRPVVVPKGPRFPEGSWSTAGHINRSATWVSPDFGRSKPSIMNPLGRDRPSFAPPVGPRSQTLIPPQHDKPRIFPGAPAQGPGSLSASPTMLRQKPSMVTLQAYGSSADQPSTSDDVDMSLPVSSEDEDEFDEDDYIASEDKHRQERLLLEAKKPPPLLQDTGVRNLLIRIQLLNMIMHDVIPKSLVTGDASDDNAKAVEPPSIGLPSPEEMADDGEGKIEVKHPQPRGRPLSQAPINPIPTPPIEDLPFRSKQSPKFMAFDESDDEVEHEAVNTLIRQKFEDAAFNWRYEIQDLHGEFRYKYPLWRQDLSTLDHERRELQPSPAPVSPAPSAAPSVTPSLSHERTRGARNTTEADLQQAILMSQQSLKEEEERREREAASNSQPNYDTEALVPDMMKPSDAELHFFEDTNMLIPTTLALDVFAYVPPEDDFTEEEQLAFIQAYCQHPKKWGKIAEAVPGRSYKDCIMHYYLTKNDVKYKIMWRNSQPKRKRGRTATKPRSTALLSEMPYDGEGEATVAVTDTGRPRRAAAPTFGDTPGDSDISTPVPQAKRLALSKEPNGDSAPAKSGRGRKAGAPAKPRRTKAQMQADQQAAMLLPAMASDGSPRKATASRERARTLLRADPAAPRADMTASPDIPRMTDVDMIHYPLTEEDRLQSALAPATGNQPTSYWSVPEQQKFPQLVAYYGKDYAAIANFMKTKTMTMIKNHFNRQLQDGKSELNELVQAHEARQRAGEPMGAPPSPAAQTKRRYEATPSTASVSRATALQPDQGVPETEQVSLPAKSIYTEDFPANAVQRVNAGVDLVSSSRPTRDVLREAQPVAPAQAKMEEMQRSQLFGQKPMTGPRSGFFKEEALGFGLPRHVLHDQSPHQHPLRPGDPRSSEGPHQQSLLGPPREPVGASSQSGLQMSPALGPSAGDKYGPPLHHHGRSGSSGMNAPHPALHEARDLSSLRRLESDPRQSNFSISRTQLPTSATPQAGIQSRSDTGSTGPPSEQPKPAPVKRSNLMNLLNDDAPEPQPPKRSSLDSGRRGPILSPQPIPVTSQSLSFEAAKAQARSEELLGIHRNVRGSLGQPPASQFGNVSLREPQPGFSGSQGDQNNERWMDRFDPRPQSGPSEPRGLHQSPQVGGYSVVPPSNTSHASHQSVRMETQRSLDAGHPDHRRMLTQMNHPGSNPSPPPQSAPQSIPPFRSLSGSSHSRFGSTGFPSNLNLSQHSPHMHPVQQPTGPPSHPPSAGSTPVSSLHHQNRPSLDFQPRRLTIQEHLAQQQQQQHQSQHRDRDHHEDALHRQREMEARQQQMRMPERDRDHHTQRQRDILGFGSATPTGHHESQPQHPAHVHNQQHHQQHSQIMAGMPGGRHLGFSQNQHQQTQREPIPRTYTPPQPPHNAGVYGVHQSHQHHTQHQSQGPPQTQGQHTHSQHAHQQQQAQQQQQQHHPQGAPPRPPQTQQQQQQRQGAPTTHGFGQYSHGHGHFRGLSQGQPQPQGQSQQGGGADERR